MNDRSTCTSATSWLLFFLAGGVTGASVALLLAPRSGEATRGLMRDKLNETASAARDLKGQVVRRGQQARDEARHRVDGAVSALAGDGANNQQA